MLRVGDRVVPDISARRWPARTRLFIDGAWADAAAGAATSRISPATGEVIAEIPQAGAEDLDRAVRAARAGHERLVALTPHERAQLVHRVADRLEARRDDIALALTLDQGKVYRTEALLEATNCARHYRIAAEGVLRLEGAVLPSADRNKRVITIRQARGVYAIITPWNFPANIPSEYLAPALATGNAVVWKPASTAAVVATVMAECFAEADLPAGAFNMLVGPGPTLGEALVAHSGVDAVGFTGEGSTGERIALRAPLKPLLLELGGNGPTIVWSDADLAAAARATATAALKNAGQICSATERVLVHEDVHSEFVALLLEEVRAVRLGMPLEEDTTMGPLNNPGVASKVRTHVEDAVRRGAALLAGGSPASGLPTELYFDATLLDGVTPEMLVFQEETFGPVIPVTSFRNESEALSLADRSSLGLTASVWTRDLRRGFLIAERLRSGLVAVNEGSHYWEPHLPFGGAPGKRSGIGRLGGREALMQMTETKTIVLDLSDRHSSLQ